MTKQLYRVERERVVTDWWYVEANDEKEAKTKAFNSEIDDSDYGEDLNVTVNKVEEKKWINVKKIIHTLIGKLLNFFGKRENEKEFTNSR